MIAFLFECYFVALTAVLMGLAAYVTNTLKKAQHVNLIGGRYERLHRWCWASAISFLVVTASLFVFTLPMTLGQRYGAMRRIRFLRAQRWNAPRSERKAGTDEERTPNEAEWGGAATMAAIRTARHVSETTGWFILYVAYPLRESDIRGFNLFGLLLLLDILAVGFAAAALVNMADPTLYARRGADLLRQLPPVQAAMLALGVVHFLSWIARYPIAARDERIVEAWEYMGAVAIAPASIEECIYVPEPERFRGFIFAIPPHTLKPAEAFCSICVKPFQPPHESVSWMQRHMIFGQIATGAPLWRFRCGHTFHIDCLQARFKEGHMDCPACFGRVRQSQYAPGAQILEVQVTDTKDSL